MHVTGYIPNAILRDTKQLSGHTKKKEKKKKELVSVTGFLFSSPRKNTGTSRKPLLLVLQVLISEERLALEVFVEQRPSAVDGFLFGHLTSAEGVGWAKEAVAGALQGRALSFSVSVIQAKHSPHPPLPYPGTLSLL